jgi:MFS family permease
MKWTAEFVLGFIGGIVGVIAGIIAQYYGYGSVLVVGAIILSIIGIAGAFVFTSHPRTSEVLMIVAAIGGVICIRMYFVLPGLLLLIAGLMGLFRKGHTTNHISPAH